jgi:hypothetical protein
MYPSTHFVNHLYLFFIYPISHKTKKDKITSHDELLELNCFYTISSPANLIPSQSKFSSSTIKQEGADPSDCTTWPPVRCAVSGSRGVQHCNCLRGVASTLPPFTRFVCMFLRILLVKLNNNNNNKPLLLWRCLLVTYETSQSASI